MQGSNARVGKSALLVVESDESDGSFLKLAPIVAVVTNIDREHLDHYSSLEGDSKGVHRFRQPGAVLWRGHSLHGGRKYPADFSQRQPPHDYLRTIGASRIWRSRGISLGQREAISQCGARGENSANFSLNVPGLHNVLNATAAIGVGLEMDVTSEQIREGLAAFTGVDRRFSVRGMARGVTVVDDYGHHPTEIRATLAAARLAPYRHIHVLFQPHRFSRTKTLLEDFGTAFHQADDLFLLDIYGASEPDDRRREY